MNLGNRGQSAGSLRSVEKSLFVAQCNPNAPQTTQDNASFRIGNDLNRSFTFGCFAPRVYL
jgi:hypothetical protein